MAKLSLQNKLRMRRRERERGHFGKYLNILIWSLNKAVVILSFNAERCFLMNYCNINMHAMKTEVLFFPTFGEIVKIFSNICRKSF